MSSGWEWRLWPHAAATCRTLASVRTYVFFLASLGMDWAIVRVERSAADLHPHDPVGVTFHANAAELEMLCYPLPQRLPVEPPIGPVRPYAPAEWAGPKAAAAHAREVATIGTHAEARAALDVAYRLAIDALEPRIAALRG